MIKLIYGDCLKELNNIEQKIDLFLSDIPYGISLNDWDVLHNNNNSALLGSSPAQKQKSGFKRRGKPLNGWSKADKNIGKEYQEWCNKWVQKLYPMMQDGSSLFIFTSRRLIHRVINAFEDNNFLLKDILAWEKPTAQFKAQRVSIVLEKRELLQDAKKWKDWRLGNLAPMFEPILWFTKPYKIGSTITDNILKNNLGALNPVITSNILKIGYDKKERGLHEAQKPLKLMETIIKLTTIENQLILDPFMGSGTTGVACKNLNRHFIGIELDENYFNIAKERIENA